MCITKLQKIEVELRILRNKFKKTYIYKRLFELFSFYFRKHKIMTPFFKNPKLHLGGSNLYNALPVHHL